MKKKCFILLCFFSLFFFFSCEKNPEPTIIFETTAGVFKVKLYKETPKHRDNFVKLVQEEFYDGLLVHRIIPNLFMQAGDPNSKTANRNRLLGTGGTGYTIASEINNPLYFHKKGALSAVRLPDGENPDRASNGSQFCIILGQIFTNAELDSLEEAAYDKRWNYEINRAIVLNRDKIAAQRNDSVKLRAVEDSILAEATAEMQKDSIFRFTPAQRKAYTTLGGVPAMDGEYTVFGEIIEGLPLLDSLAKQPADRNARPLNDVRILRAWVEK